MDVTAGRLDGVLDPWPGRAAGTAEKLRTSAGGLDRAAERLPFSDSGSGAGAGAGAGAGVKVDALRLIPAVERVAIGMASATSGVGAGAGATAGAAVGRWVGVSVYVGV